MMQILAQSGGGGAWLNPHLIQVVVVTLIFLFSLLGRTFKKIQEQNAKRAAELAVERRREEMLRTGRDETGAFVGLSKGPSAQAPASAAPALTTGDEARRKLQQLAEQRRKELAQMVRQGRQGRARTQQRPGAQPPQRDIPPIIATAPMPAPPRAAPPARPVSPGMPVFQPARPASERDVRRQRDEQANKKAAQQAAAKRKAQEAERSRPQPAPSIEPRIDTSLAAYAIAPQKEAVPAGASKPSSGARVAAALDRLGGRPGAPTNAAAEWRRAIVLGELMRSPLAMRPPSEGI